MANKKVKDKISDDDLDFIDNLIGAIFGFLTDETFSYSAGCWAFVTAECNRR